MREKSAFFTGYYLLIYEPIVLKLGALGGQNGTFILLLGVRLDTVQDFLTKLGIKPCMHLLEIVIFSLYYVIIRLAKIINKSWAHF